MGLEKLFGLTTKSMKVTGKIVRCMEKVYFVGLTGEYTKVNILMIKNTDLERSSGPMAEYTKDNGNKAFSMVKASIKEETGFGSKETGSTVNA
jgi:hypothetical protein